MKDNNGLYYHPDPSDIKTRVYVREGLLGPEFRLWRADYPEVWEKHGWLSREIIAAAADIYKQGGSGADPLVFYDSNVAKALLKDDARKKS